MISVPAGSERVLDKVLADVRRLVDFDVISEGMERQAAAWRFKDVDRPPLTVNFPVERHRFTYREIFEDPAKMLIAQLESNVYAHLLAKDDAVPAVRPDYGIVVIPAAFGCEVRVPENDMPWVVGRVEWSGKPDPSLLKEPVFDEGLPARVLETERYFVGKLDGTGVRVYLADTQGPFNLAHQVMGELLFVSLYRYPDEVKEILSRMVDAYVEFTGIQKRVVGEPLDRGAHGWDRQDGPSGIWMDRGGVRLCDDSAAMLSPRHFREFCMPFNSKCLSPFGGGLWHACGRVSHILKLALDTPGVNAVHLGNPEKHSFDEVRRLTYEKRVCLVWKDRVSEEHPRRYAEQMAKSLDGDVSGVIFSVDVPSLEYGLKLKEAWIDVFG